MPLARARIGLDEANLVVFEADDAPIADRDLENVGGQVRERRIPAGEGHRPDLCQKPGLGPVPPPHGAAVDVSPTPHPHTTG